MNKTQKRGGKRRFELLLLLVVVAVFFHFVEGQRQLNLSAQKAREQAAKENTVQFLEELSTGVQVTIAAWPKTLPEAKLRVANRHLEREPDNIEWLRKRADAQADLGELGLALQDLSKILELDPTEYNALRWHATYSAELGFRKVAIAELEKLERLFEGDTVPASLLNERAQYLAEEGQFKEALIVAQKADSIEPNNASIHATLGYIHTGFGDYQAALEAYSQAIVLNPRSVRALKGRAVVYHKLGQLELSQQAASTALDRR